MSEELSSYMLKTAKGNKESFRFIANALGYKMYSTALKLLGSRNFCEAEDAVQISLIKIWQNAPRWKSKGSLEGYVYRIVFSTCMDLHRKSKDIKELKENYSTKEIKNNDFINHELRKNLLLNIKKLPKQQHQAILLHYFCGYKQKEVSCILNKSEKATESLILRARRKLKDTLPKDLMEEFFYV